MSRVCVKNLPKYVAEDRLRDLFSQKGEITDLKLMRTRDGKSRQFAFIGFREDREAVEAIRFFNNSFVDTAKIVCEIAHKVGDPETPRPWSKYSMKKDNKPDGKAETSGFKKTSTSSDQAKPVKISSNDEPELQEFLQVMQPRVKSKLWANDTTGESVGKGPKVEEKGCHRKHVVLNDVDDEENPQDISRNAYENTVENSKDEKLESTKGEDISDMEYFKSKVRERWSDAESEDEIKSEEEKELHDEIGIEEQIRTHSEKKAVMNYEFYNNDLQNSSSMPDETEQATDSGRLFVRNLSYTTTEDDLLEPFSKFGDVSSIHLVVDKDTKRSKGIAFVQYILPETAVRALEELDKTIFQGRLLHILPAQPQIVPPNKLDAVKQDQKNFKQRREEQRRKSEVNGDSRSWNSLFMRQETVVENIARKYGVSKSEFLDREADDLAVRMALGETHVIDETKKALSNAGINVSALDALASRKIEKSQRSDHVILVKNLPYHIREGDLEEMFQKFGSLEKIILPPTKTLALVIFLESAEAQKAFKALAYKRYIDAPLYLEWAPSNIFSPRTTSETEQQNNAVGEKDVKKVIFEQVVEGVDEVDLDPDRVESRSVYVKNLNFKTTDDSLRNHFSEVLKKGKINSVKIKKHEKKGKIVSMGYGFIEFDSVETATDVCRDLQGTILDGHALILQLCRFKKDDSAAKRVDKGKSLTKLLVKNVPFVATKKDVTQLFSPFGQIKSVRMPNKFGNYKGFAFIEYLTKQEAQNALKALSNTHLYGRRLNIEPANENESLEELRAKTASQFSDHENGLKLSKKRKNLDLFDDEKTKFSRIMD